MYAIKNKVQLMGHLGRDPDVRVMDSGKKRATFSMATNESYRNAKGERISETQWHNLVAWGKLAEIAEQYLQKGSEVLIEGKLVNRSYTNGEGIKKFAFEIQVRDLVLLGSKRASA